MRASFLAEAADTIAAAEAKFAQIHELEPEDRAALGFSHDRVQLAIASSLHSIAADLHKIAMRPPTTGLGSRS